MLYLHPYVRIGNLRRTNYYTALTVSNLSAPHWYWCVIGPITSQNKHSMLSYFYFFNCKYKSPVSCNVCRNIEDVNIYLLFVNVKTGILVQCYILLNNGNMQSSGFILNGKQNAKFLGTIVSFLAYKIYELIFFCRSHYKSETHYMMIFFTKGT